MDNIEDRVRAGIRDDETLTPFGQQMLLMCEVTSLLRSIRQRMDSDRACGFAGPNTLREYTGG